MPLTGVISVTDDANHAFVLPFGNTVKSNMGQSPMLTPLAHRFTLVGSLLLLAANAVSQELSLEEMVPALKERAIVMDIVSRVVERDQEEVWNSVNSKVTILGRPVGIKLVGTNIIVAVQFTPYRQRNGRNVLVAQGQIWLDVPNQGIRYQTTIETIPLEYGEQIYFFPLGQASNPNTPRIEIRIELRPYVAEPPAQVQEELPPQTKETAGPP
jgi:hypothetical protein